MAKSKSKRDLMMNRKSTAKRRVDRNAVLALFELYAQKGAVAMPGAKKTADAAWLKLSPWLKPENRMRLLVARAHALAGEGRGEFDALVAKLRPEFEAFAGVRKEQDLEPAPVERLEVDRHLFDTICEELVRAKEKKDG